MPKRKRTRRYKNEPGAYDELKKQISATLTPTAIQGLNAHAKAWDTSRSDFLELIGRGEIAVPSPQEMERLGESSANTKPNSLIKSTDSGSTKGANPKENKQPSFIS